MCCSLIVPVQMVDDGIFGISGMQGEHAHVSSWTQVHTIQAFR